MLSIRAKLTLWYLLVTFAGAVLFGVTSYGVLFYALISEKKTHLLGRENRLMHLLEINSQQHVRVPLYNQLRSYALATHEGQLFQIREPDGTLLYPATSTNEDWALRDRMNCQRRSFIRFSIATIPTLVMCHTVVVDGTYVNLYIGGSLEQEYDILRIYRNALMFLLPGLLLLSSYCGFLLSRRAMSPVDRMTKAALGIGIGNLAERLPVPSTKDEVQQLAEAWNQLLARLESAVRRLSQFSADISHDLRTSITVMLATAQLALSQSRSEVEYREDLNRIASECRSATTLLDALLSIVRSNNFVHEMSLQRLDLAELGLQGCRRVEDLAEAKNILLDWELPPHQVMIEGDEVLIHRLLGILLENAIKYTPEHGEVHLRVDIVENEAQLIVCDTGIGISPDAKAQIFERFYQADMRERTTPVGSGLGLSIARWIVDAHRARISVKSEHSSGTSFIIHFSLVTDAQSVSQYEQVGIPQ